MLDEVFSNFQFPGNSLVPSTSYGAPFTLDLSDTIASGTGRFAGASGTATGHVTQAGGVAIITLSGTITY